MVFDMYGRIIQWNSKLFDSSKKALVDYYQISLTYTPDGQYSVITDKIWNSTQNVWTDKARYSYSYNSLQQCTNVLLEYYEPASAKWDKYSNSIYSYDSQGRKIIFLWQKWDAVNSVFQNASQYKYTYDSWGNMSSERMQSWVSSAWLDQYRNLFFYNCTSVGLTEKNAEAYAVFPNPVAGQIILPEGKFAYRVIDLGGRLVQQGEARTTIEVNNLLPGIYILELSDSSGAKKTQKFVKH